MTKTHKTDSHPTPPADKPNKKDKDKSKDDDDQTNLENAIGTYSIMMLQNILQGAKQRRAEMNEDDPDKF